MESNIQNKKGVRNEDKDLWITLIWIPVFALGYYIVMAMGIPILLYPLKLNLTVLGIKLLATALIGIATFVILLGSIFYYKVIRRIIAAYKIAHNKV